LEIVIFFPDPSRNFSILLNSLGNCDFPRPLQKLQIWGPFGKVEFSTPLENVVHGWGGGGVVDNREVKINVYGRPVTTNTKLQFAFEGKF
jgi:hypothetical protein